MHVLDEKLIKQIKLWELEKFLRTGINYIMTTKAKGCRGHCINTDETSFNASKHIPAS